MLVTLDTPIKSRGREVEDLLATRFPSVVMFERRGVESCAALRPILEDMARELVERVRVIRVEETDPATARRFGVEVVPTLVFWRQGREVGRIEGDAAAGAIRGHVRHLLGEVSQPRTLRPSEGAVPVSVPVGQAVDATDATFASLVLRSGGPVLVGFWAVWCASCRGTGRLLDELARDYAGRVRVVKVNTDESTDWPARLRIMGVPAFVTFRDGREVGRLLGPATRSALEEAVEGLLAAA